MNHTKVLQRAWHVVWNYRALWIFGIVLALLAAGGASRGSSGSVQRGFDGQDFTPFRRVYTGEIPTEVVGALIAVGLSMTLLILAVIVVTALARYVAETTLIRMVDDHEKTGEKRSVGQGLKMGFSRTSLRLWAIDLLINLPVVLASIMLFVLALAPLLLWATESRTAGVIGTVTTGGLYLFLIAVVIVGGTVLSVLTKFFWRACAVENLGVAESIRKGFIVARQRPVDVILMWLIMFVIEIGWTVAMIVLGIVLMPMTIVAIVAAAMVGGLPGFLVYGLTSLFLEGAVPWIIAGLVGIPFLVISVVVAGIVAGLPMLFLRGLMEVFKSSVWTLSYRELVALEAELVSASVPDTSSLKAAPASSGG
jgi:hypothetical protein